MAGSVRGREIVQLGYICADPRGAATRWAETMGAGPFFPFEMFRFEGWMFEGQPVDTPIDLTMGNCGTLNIEFIRSRAPHRTIYGEPDSAPRTPVLHHVAILSDDWARDMGGFADMPLLGTAHTANGSRFCYRDARETLGTVLEIIEAGDDVTALLGLIRDASTRWDGKEVFASL